MLVCLKVLCGQTEKAALHDHQVIHKEAPVPFLWWKAALERTEKVQGRHLRMGVVLHLVHLRRWHILATLGLALAEARDHLVLRLHKHRASGSFQSRRPLLAELVRQGGSAALGRWRLRVVLTGVLGFVVRGREDGFVVGEGMAPASVGEEGKGPLSLAPSNQASASAARSPSDLVAKGRSLGGGVTASTGRSRLGGVRVPAPARSACSLFFCARCSATTLSRRCRPSSWCH